MFLEKRNVLVTTKAHSRSLDELNKVFIGCSWRIKELHRLKGLQI